MKNTKFYCTFGLIFFMVFCTFGKNEGLPFKAEKQSLLRSLTTHPPPPPNEMEDPENLGLCAKKEQESCWFFFLRFSFHLQHLYASFMDFSIFCNSTMSYFKQSVFLLYSNTVQIGNLIVIILFLSLSRPLHYGEIILGAPSTNPLNTFLISLMNYCGGKN